MLILASFSTPSPLFIGTNIIGFHDTTSQAQLSFNPAEHPFFEVAGILAATISRDKDDLISVSAYFNGELILGPSRQVPREGAEPMVPSPGIIFFPPAETLPETLPENLRFSGFGLRQGLNADIYAAALYDMALTAEGIKKVSDALALGSTFVYLVYSLTFPPGCRTPRLCHHSSLPNFASP